MNASTIESANVRSSNLELYRIICMLMIVAHHLVVHSGFTKGLLQEDVTTFNSAFLWLFGMWGKAGINSFLMITGYFMCKSRITLRKFVKLLLEIYFYRLVISIIFLAVGYEQFSLSTIARLVSPVWGFETNFASCFIGFYLTIPFINILIRNMTKYQHLLLLLLLLGMNTVLGSIPTFDIGMNYVTWFGVIYLIAAYFRLYPSPLTENKKLWGVVTISVILAAMLSVLAGLYVGKYPHFLLSETNKFFAVAFAVPSFLWFKNIRIPQSGIINAIGGSTFGVLLIHDASGSMRKWLWTDLVNCPDHFSLPAVKLIVFCFCTVLVVFAICIIIDRLRIRLLEKPFFVWYDKLFQQKPVTGEIH